MRWWIGDVSAAWEVGRTRRAGRSNITGTNYFVKQIRELCNVASTWNLFFLIGRKWVVSDVGTFKLVNEWFRRKSHSQKTKKAFQIEFRRHALCISAGLWEEVRDLLSVLSVHLHLFSFGLLTLNPREISLTRRKQFFAFVSFQCCDFYQSSLKTFGWDLWHGFFIRTNGSWVNYWAKHFCLWSHRSRAVQGGKKPHYITSLS